MALSDFIKKKRGALTDVDEDKGGKKGIRRRLEIYYHSLMFVFGCVLQLYAAGSGLVDDKYVVSIHLAVIILLIYLLFPANETFKQ